MTTLNRSGLGESLTALGVGAAMALWWLYFDVVTLVARRRLHQAGSEDRLALAAGAYGVGHFPVVAGIVHTALGVEGVVGHAGSGHGLGWFSAGALCGGAALYLGGLLLFGRLAVNVWGPFRLVALVVVAAWTSAAAALPPLAALAGVVGDMGPLFAALDQDAPGALDAVRDEANMPPAQEPQRVRADLDAVRTPATSGST